MELPAAHAKAENEARAQRHALNAYVSTGFFHFQKYSPSDHPGKARQSGRHSHRAENHLAQGVLNNSRGAQGDRHEDSGEENSAL